MKVQCLQIWFNYKSRLGLGLSRQYLRLLHYTFILKRIQENAIPIKNFLTAFKVRGKYIYKINYRRHNGFSLKKLSEIICYYLNQKD